MALIAEELGDRVGFLTVLIDLDSDRGAAIQITESASAPFLTIDANDNVFGSFGRYFTSPYIPQSILIDGEGNLIELLVGGDADTYRSAIESALNP